VVGCFGGGGGGGGPRLKVPTAFPERLG